MNDFFRINETDYDILYHINSNKVFKVSKLLEDSTDEDLYKRFDLSKENKIEDLKG